MEENNIDIKEIAKDFVDNNKPFTLSMFKNIELIEEIRKYRFERLFKRKK